MRRKILSNWLVKKRYSKYAKLQGWKLVVHHADIFLKLVIASICLYLTLEILKYFKLF